MFLPIYKLLLGLSQVMVAYLDGLEDQVGPVNIEDVVFSV